MNSSHALEAGPREACGVFGIVAPVHAPSPALANASPDPTAEAAKSATTGTSNFTNAHPREAT